MTKLQLIIMITLKSSQSHLAVVTREDCNQSAAQMWTLARLFPFMIAELIPPDDETWQLVILLGQIASIVFAPKI